MLYMAKVYINKQMRNVRVYEDYEHVISDIIDKESDLYWHIDEVNNDEVTDYKNPHIYSPSLDDMDFNVDFTFSYPNGVSIYVDSMFTVESLYRTSSSQ